MDITRQDDGRKGRYAAPVAGSDRDAELTYTHQSEGRISADHTLVPEAAEGQGVGSALVRRLVEDARAEGWTIEPRCPFVRAMAERHPDWADVFAG